MSKQQYKVGQYIRIKLTPGLTNYLYDKQIEPQEFIKHTYRIAITLDNGGVVIEVLNHSDKFIHSRLAIYSNEIAGIQPRQLVFFPMD